MTTASRVLAVVAGLATVLGGIALLVRDRGSQVGVLVMAVGLALAGFGMRSLMVRLGRRWVREDGDPLEPPRQSAAGKEVDVLCGTGTGRPGPLDRFPR